MLHCQIISFWPLTQGNSELSSPPSPGLACSALLIAAGTVGLGGALGAIFAAGDVEREDRKLRSIQDSDLSRSGTDAFMMDRYASNAINTDTARYRSDLIEDGMARC